MRVTLAGGGVGGVGVTTTDEISASFVPMVKDLWSEPQLLRRRSRRHYCVALDHNVWKKKAHATISSKSRTTPRYSSCQQIDPTFSNISSSYLKQTICKSDTAVCSAQATARSTDNISADGDLQWHYGTKPPTRSVANRFYRLPHSKSCSLPYTIHGL
jgi:hypothetical protein